MLFKNLLSVAEMTAAVYEMEIFSVPLNKRRNHNTQSQTKTGNWSKLNDRLWNDSFFLTDSWYLQDLHCS